MRLIVAIIALFICLSCSTQQNSSRARLSNTQDLLSPESTKNLITGQSSPPKPEDLKSELKSEINKWWYGHGVGRTATNIATIVVFPPWGLYLLANAGISLVGYQPLYITDALGENTRQGVLESYDSLTSVPGRTNAFIAGERFYNSPTAKQKKEQKNEKSRDSSKIVAFSSKRTR